MRPRSKVPAALLASLAISALASCGGKARAPETASAANAGPTGTAGTRAPAAPGQGSAVTLIHKVTPSRLLPEIVGTRGQVAAEDGAERVLVDRMRLVVRADGSLDRAAELLPEGSVQSIALPSRLGGGYLFHASSNGGTEIWRAAGWLDKLHPVARRNDVVSDIVPGFDRLYLRLQFANRVIAVDARSGEPMPLGPLPVAGGYGLLAFADGWRAVVDTDLRGPLATFDAGATWRPVGLTERPLSVGVVDGNPAVMVNGGRYLIDPRGGVTFRTERDLHERAAEKLEHGGGARGEGPPGDADPHRPSPLGKRPLRAAVEDGWPDTETTAVVARGGALGRVSLHDGSVVAVAEDAYPEHRGTCHAVRLGLHGVGFVCGEHDGPTTVYAYEPPLAMRPVLRFERPRAVVASGNGALVLRGRCADDSGKGASSGSGAATAPAPAAAPDDGDARWYCVRSPTGDLREIRVKGASADLGVERVVGLGDGRIAVIVPPRGGSPGGLSIISGGAAASVPLELPAEPRGAAHDIKRGMWLDGFEERQPGVLGGWVEAGGPFIGIEVTLDGKVKAGEGREDAGAIFGGRFAVALGEGGRAAETTDGGMSWAAFDLPERDEEARAVPSRGCGPVGCSLPGWVRVGWGETASPDDMKDAESPSTSFPLLKVSPTLHFDCAVGSVATPPLPEKRRPPVPTRPRRGAGPAAAAAPGARPAPRHDTPWLAFRNTEPPALAAEDYGIDNGPVQFDALRTYAWGKSGSDWTRSGRWMIRFDDRFDASPAGGVRSTSVTTSLWSHQAEALEGIGTHSSYGTASWHVFADPSGRAVLATSCRNSNCSLYAVGDGQPILPVRGQSGATGGFTLPYDNAAVRVGETWFYLSQTPSYDAVALWRIDLGVARQIGTYYRPNQRNHTDSPRLARRAHGTGVGLLIGGSPLPNERVGMWYVLPVDAETGVLGEPVALGRRDFAGMALPRCAPEQDGWTFDVAPETTTNVEVENARAQPLDVVDMRVRLDPGRACVESLATRSGVFYPRGLRPAGSPPLPPLTAPPARKSPADDSAIPMAVTERSTGRRWGLSCKIRR